MTTSPKQRWTLLELLNWCTSYFKKHGVDSARLDAELLLAHGLGLERIQLYTQFDRPMVDAELTALKALIVRRARQREPVAYILGQRDFWTLTLKVTPDVLIPRPETERVVEAALLVARDAERPQPAHPLRVADVGTGSGALALALARELPDAQVWATDLSAAALGVARENAALNDLTARVAFLEGDLLAPLPASARPLDLIVSNPPYVSDEEVGALAPEVGDHEPRLALAAGPEGLDIYRRLVPDAFEALRPGGVLLCEIGATQGPAVRACFERAGFAEVAVLPDLARHDRVVSGRRP